MIAPHNAWHSCATGAGGAVSVAAAAAPRAVAPESRPGSGRLGPRGGGAGEAVADVARPRVAACAGEPRTPWAVTGPLTGPAAAVTGSSLLGATNDGDLTMLSKSFTLQHA